VYWIANIADEGMNRGSSCPWWQLFDHLQSRARISMGQETAKLKSVSSGVIESRMVILKAEVSPGPKLNGTKDHISRPRVKTRTSRVKAGSQNPGFGADADTRPMYGARGW
jgi:hypothetical protein